MTAEDIARDLMVTSVQDSIENALVSAAKQGEALLQGKFDGLVEAYDEAVGEYKLATDEHEGDAPVSDYEIYEDRLLDLVHEFARLAGREET